MTTVYHELLPESYLLLLTPGSPTAPEYGLSYSLSCAYQSGKPAVWVDCELVQALSAESARTLLDYHRRLKHEHKQLLVVHASEELKEGLLLPQLASELCFVPTLLDAAWQSGLRMVA